MVLFSYHVGAVFASTCGGTTTTTTMKHRYYMPCIWGGVVPRDVTADATSYQVSEKCIIHWLTLVLSSSFIVLVSVHKGDCTKTHSSGLMVCGLFPCPRRVYSSSSSLSLFSLSLSIFSLSIFSLSLLSAYQVSVKYTIHMAYVYTTVFILHRTSKYTTGVYHKPIAGLIVCGLCAFREGVI